MGLQLLDQFDFHRALADTSGVALVCFTAPRCGPCKAMLRALNQLAETRPGIRLFEVDSQRDAALAREFDLFHLPALFLYRQGEYHAPLQCPPQVEELSRAMEELLAQPAREAP